MVTNMQIVNSKRKSSSPGHCSESKNPVRVFFKDNNKSFSYRKIKGLFYKNLVLLRRDYMLLVTAMILPFLNTYLFNVAVGRNPQGLSIAVVNDEMSMSNCSNAPYNGCFFNENHTFPVSCLYIDLLRTKNYTIIEYQNESVAINDVRQNHVWALLHFTHNFTAALASRVSDGFNVDPTSIAQSSVNTWIDSSNRLFQSIIMYDVARVMASCLEQVMQKCGMNPKLGSIPIEFEEPIFGSVDENFISYASCALICIDCFVLPSVWTCIQTFLEKYDGILERTMVTGAGVLDMTAAIFAFQFIVQFIQTLISMSVMYIMFENPLYGNFVTFFSLMMVTGTAGIFYGIALGIFSDNFLSLGALSNAILMTTCLITGLMWPIEGIQYVLKLLTWMFPITWIVSATRAICLKNFSFFSPAVLNGFASGVFLNIGCVVCIFLIAKYKKTAFTIGR